MANYQTMTSNKNKDIALLLCIFGGIFGLHQFYFGNIGKGVLYLFTGGILGIGWIMDIIRILNGSFEMMINMKLTKNSEWEKIAFNFYINQEYKKLKVNKREICFGDIINVDLIEDEESISKTTGTNKTKGKAQKHIAPIKGIIGGAVLGPAGAMIGGTSGKTDIKSKTKVNTTTKNIYYCTNLSIKITLNDINNPMIMYNFISMRTDKNSYIYKNNYDKAQRCISIIQAIINNNK